MKLRIAHLGSKGVPSTGGTERVVEALAVRQARAGHVVTVYGRTGYAPSGPYKDVRVRVLPALPLKHLGPALVEALSALECSAVRRHDIIHLHGTENAFVLPLLRARYPVVMTSHGLMGAGLGKWSPAAAALVGSYERWSVRLPSVSTSVSALHAEQLSERHGRKVEYVPNGVETDEQVDEEAARRYLSSRSLNPSNYLLFASGRVLPSKGCHLLIEAARRLPRPMPVLVIGDRSHIPQYDKMLTDAARGLPVVFGSHVDDKPTLLGLLRLALAFVYPTATEGMSMMLLEAMSAGALCLASDIPQNTAVLPPDSPKFRAGDLEDLVAQLGAVIAWRERHRDAVAAEGRSRVRLSFDWDKIAECYERLYFDALSRTTRG